MGWTAPSCGLEVGTQFPIGLDSPITTTWAGQPHHGLDSPIMGWTAHGLDSPSMGWTAPPRKQKAQVHDMQLGMNICLSEAA